MEISADAFAGGVLPNANFMYQLSLFVCVCVCVCLLSVVCNGYRGYNSMYVGTTGANETTVGKK